MDELKLIKEIEKLFPAQKAKIGIGDDAAVIEAGDNFLLLTVDTIVEDVHFKKKWLSPLQLGRRSLIINISDISAMGGVPIYGLVALNMGKFTDQEIEEFFRGIREQANISGIEIIGGNISSSDKFSAAITLIGESGKPVTRSGAKPGELIVITGNIGDAAAGVQILLNGIRSEKWEKLVKAFTDPPVLTEEARKIGKFASSMIDISDGLLIDLWRITQLSGCGAIVEVENIPRSREFIDFSEKFPQLKNKIYWGGEDYQLLFTISPDRLKELKSEWNFQTTLTIIGKTVPEKELLIQDRNGTRVVHISGWIHK